MKPPKRALRFAPVREVGKVRQVRQVRHSPLVPIQGARSEGSRYQEASTTACVARAPCMPPPVAALRRLCPRRRRSRPTVLEFTPAARARRLPKVCCTLRRGVGHQPGAAQLLPVDRRLLYRCVRCSTRVRASLGTRKWSRAWRCQCSTQCLRQHGALAAMLNTGHPQRGRFRCAVA